MKIEGDAKTIAAAFLKARSEMNSTVAKDAKGNYGKYATLAAIVEATSPAFAKHGLAIVQEVESNEQGVAVVTWLIHESGATMQFAPLVMPLADRKPQAVGSAITYGRRYALAAVCGLAPDDDDGQAAQDAQNKAQAARKAQQGSNTPKRAVDAGTGEIEPSEAEPQDDSATPTQLKRLHAIGREFYGDEWDEQRPKLVYAVSKGVVTSSNDLKAVEADRLIRGIEKKMTEVAARKAAYAAKQTVENGATVQ